MRPPYLLFCILFLIHFVSHSQTGKLNLTIYNELDTETNCYKWCVLNNKDTIKTELFQANYEVRFDTLLPMGTYQVTIYNCLKPSEEHFIKTFTILPNKLNKIYVEPSFYQEFIELDEELNGVETYYDELQFLFSVVDNRWIEKNSIFRYNNRIGCSYYLWNAYTKHVGVLVGGGIGYSRYYLSKDTTFLPLSFPQKTTEFYHYLDGHVEAKLRFTASSQQRADLIGYQSQLDLGLVYYAPIFFRQVADYETDKRIMNRHLHQYTDFRAHVGFGYSFLHVFAEYRLTDFLLGNYPEIPRINFGVKISGTSR